MARGQAKGNSGGNMNQQTTTSQDHEMGVSQSFKQKDGKMYLYVAVTRGPLLGSLARNTQVGHFT